MIFQNHNSRRRECCCCSCCAVERELLDCHFSLRTTHWYWAESVKYWKKSYFLCVSSERVHPSVSPFSPSPAVVRPELRWIILSFNDSFDKCSMQIYPSTLHPHFAELNGWENCYEMMTESTSLDSWDCVAEGLWIVGAQQSRTQITIFFAYVKLDIY